jgi:cyclomaltodextrinase
VSLDLAIRHEPRPPYAYPLADGRIRVRLRTALDDRRRPSIFWGDRQNWARADLSAPMRPYAEDERYRHWEADVVPFEGRVRYTFRLDDPSTRAQTWIGESGASATRPGAEWPDGYFHWPYVHREQLPDTPAWVRDAVCYEIFPDRFAHGNPPVAPEVGEDWPGYPTHFARWGGDLVGVLDRLPYLEALGVNMLWLTPIFASPSNHKYDTSDYGRIDPTFGNEEIFARLVSTARDHGIRIVLDGVFNHSGLHFAPWRDVLARGMDSPYWAWFDVQGARPDLQARNYHTFAQTPFMPRLMTGNPEVQTYLIEQAGRWMRMGIAGWRLDVADEVDMSFWRAFRREMRRITPDAYLVGEIAYNASPWLEGDQFDGVMNYPLRRALLQFVAPPHQTVGTPPPEERLDARGFLAALGRLRSWYPSWATTAMLNPLSTHDVPRFLTACGSDVRRWRLGATFLLTYEGIPMLYYGDEIGLEGGHDPDTRRPMIWEPAGQRADMLAFTRTLIRLRREWPALRASGFRPIATDHPRVAAFLRGTSGTEEVAAGRLPSDAVLLVILNSGEEAATLDLSTLQHESSPTWPAAPHALDILTGRSHRYERSRLHISIPPLEAAVLVPTSLC